MATASNRISKVAVVGAGGYIGGYIARALLKTGHHSVTALTRHGSKSELPKGAAVKAVDYDDHDSLVAAIRGHDFLVITLSIRAAPDAGSKLARAAAAAGIKYVMPNAYGPNPYDAELYNDMGFGQRFEKSMAELEELKLLPVVLTCGFWYEFSVAGGTERYGFDIPGRRFVLFDNGDVPIYTSTWEQCGRAAAALLSLPVKAEAGSTTLTLSQFAGANPEKRAYINSFHLSQRDMFDSIKRVTDTTDADWTITQEPARERWANANKVLKSGQPGVHLDGKTPLGVMNAFGMNMYSRIFFPGSDGLQDGDFVNKLLGLPKENLDQSTAEAVRLVQEGTLSSYGQ